MSGSRSVDRPEGDPHRGFLREAVQLAEESVRSGGGPFGAVVVRDGEVIARGTNRVTESNDPTAHAELVAIREACRLLGDFQLAECRIYASSEPCPMCMGAIYWARPAAVYYATDRAVAAASGFDDDFIYEELALAPDRRGLRVRQLELDGAETPFALWTATPDRIEY